ncbi:MAG: glycosyltransferase family 1 protein [Acidobacteria bacterium]|mgnify:CR=1 FL=1|nr:MAG: glycosyltransferase family 1 protein [Acidobacteriota bacterium]REK08689.1 MAG: glycosyltransferase family 1 protein [Acidobacteriota bacterium]
MLLMLRGRGRLQSVPAPLRPLVQWPLDLLRRTAGRLRSSLRRLAPRRIRRTLTWLAQVFGRHRQLRRADGLCVAIDVDPLYLPLTGVGWYLRLVLEELRDEPDLHLRLYGPWLQGLSADAPQPSRPLPEGAAIDLVAHPLDDDLTLPPAWQNRLLRLLQPLLVRYDRNQVVFAPNFIVPRRLRLARGRLVVTVHDLAMRKFPWTLSEGTRALLDADLDAAIRRADRIVTPSHTVRGEIVEDGLFAAAAVHAVPHGPGHLGHAGDARQADLPPPLRGVGGEAVPYALHVGTIEPRKNLGLLLDVWEGAVGGSPRGEGSVALPRLVWCGGVGWKSDELLRRAEAGVDAGWLVRPGYVDDATLRRLYVDALCLVMPSLYEGFGLPLVEAMVSGTPVLCSDIPVFREVAGEAALLLPVDDPEAWRSAIGRLASEPGLRRQLAEAGRRRVAGLDWRRSAAETLRVWRLASASTGGAVESP